VVGTILGGKEGWRVGFLDGAFVGCKKEMRKSHQQK